MRSDRMHCLLRMGAASASLLAFLTVFGCATTGQTFFASQEDGRRAMAGGGSNLRLIANSEDVGGYFDVVEHTWPPGAVGNMHVHDFDAFYFVLDGTVTVDYGDRTFTGSPGSLFFHPKGVPHSHRDASGEGFTMLLLYAPGFGEGMNKLLDEMSKLDPKDPDFGAQSSQVLKSVGKTEPR